MTAARQNRRDRPRGYARRLRKPLHLRPATPADLDVLRTLLAVLHGGRPPWDADREPAVRAALARIAQDPRRLLVLALWDGEPVGTLDAVVVDNLTRAGRPWAAIENVVVLPSHRRRGIGRALLQAAADHARRHDAYKLQLVSSAGRDEAHRLYAESGFTADVRGYRRYL